MATTTTSRVSLTPTAAATKRVAAVPSGGSTKRVHYYDAVDGVQYQPWLNSWANSWGNTWNFTSASNASVPAVSKTKRVPINPT